MLEREKWIRYFVWLSLIVVLLVGGVAAYSFLVRDQLSLEQFGKDLPPEKRARTIELIEKYKTLIKKEPNNPDHWLQLGLNLEQLGDVYGAIKSDEKAAQLGPRAFGTFSVLGALYEKTHQYERAEVAYLTAIKDDPARTFLYAPLVSLYTNYITGKKNKIPELLTAGMALPGNQENPALLEMLAVHYKNEHDVPNAISTYERLLRATPGNATAKEELKELKQNK